MRFSESYLGRWLAWLVIVSALLINGGCAVMPFSNKDDSQVRLDKNLDTRMVPSLTMARLETANPLHQRLIAGFSLPRHDNPVIKSYRDKIIGNPKSLQTTLNRSEPYLAYILDAVESRGMPAEIALLPIVESEFNPLVRSPSGAAGLWQIVPATGRGLKLRQDRWYDGRLDVVDSTRAALDYLSRLHKMFDHDWLLALAAYNAGEGNLRKAIRKNRQNGRSSAYFTLPLKLETRVFVPKLLAIRDILRSPRFYGMNFSLPGPHQQFTTVNANRRFSVHSLGRVCAAPASLMTLLNAGLLRGISPPNGPHISRIPPGCVANLETRLASDLAANPLPKAVAAKPKVHRVKSGDSLWAIARAYQVTVASLARWNKIAVNSTLRLGQKLLIYPK